MSKYEKFQYFKGAEALVKCKDETEWRAVLSLAAGLVIPIGVHSSAVDFSDSPYILWTKHNDEGFYWHLCRISEREADSRDNIELYEFKAFCNQLLNPKPLIVKIDDLPEMYMSVDKDGVHSGTGLSLSHESFDIVAKAVEEYRKA